MFPLPTDLLPTHLAKSLFPCDAMRLRLSSLRAACIHQPGLWDAFWAKGSLDGDCLAISQENYDCLASKWSFGLVTAPSEIHTKPPRNASSVNPVPEWIAKRDAACLGCVHQVISGFSELCDLRPEWGCLAHARRLVWLECPAVIPRWLRGS